jgi:hypothetical protein
MVEASLDGVVDSTGATAEIDDEEEDSAEESLWFPYFKPNMTISMVDMFEAHNLNAIPPHLDPILQLSHDSEKYYPLIYFNEFWTLKVGLLPSLSL